MERAFQPTNDLVANIQQTRRSIDPLDTARIPTLYQLACAAYNPENIPEYSRLFFALIHDLPWPADMIFIQTEEADETQSTEDSIYLRPRWRLAYANPRQLNRYSAIATIVRTTPNGSFPTAMTYTEVRCGGSADAGGTHGDPNRLKQAILSLIPAGDIPETVGFSDFPWDSYQDRCLLPAWGYHAPRLD